MKAHFFDLDTLLLVDNKVWLVSKNNPNEPIIKISKSNFNLLKNGIWKAQRNGIDIGGHTYYFPNDLINDIKIKLAKNNIDISSLFFSMQEFLNPDVIETLDYDLNIDNIQHLKNKTDHIYIICSKNTEENYKKMIKKLEEKLEILGLSIIKYYYISETFYNRDEDGIIYKKLRLLLQHLIGLKTDGDKFTDFELEKYDRVYFYDDDVKTIKSAKNINDYLNMCIKNSNDSEKIKIKEILKNNLFLDVIEVTPNKVNKFIPYEINLKFNNIIKTFESYKRIK